MIKQIFGPEIFEKYKINLRVILLTDLLQAISTFKKIKRRTNILHFYRLKMHQYQYSGQCTKRGTSFFDNFIAISPLTVLWNHLPNM